MSGQGEEPVQRPGNSTAPRSARNAGQVCVSVCEGVPRTSTLKTLSKPPCMRPVQGPGRPSPTLTKPSGQWGKQKPTTRAEILGGRKPEVGDQGGLPGGRVS